MTSIVENIRFYRGNSMHGTFRLGDRLLIEPVLFVDISLGDIIIYQEVNEKENTEDVVHRVVAITEDGLITRGDNNRCRDFSPVQQDQIIGKVVEKEIGGQKFAVVGGTRGLRRAKLQWTILGLKCFFHRIFRYPYYLIRNSRIIPNLWRPVIVRIYLNTDHGVLVKYIYKNHTIATWKPTHQRFDCRKPFDLVIPSPLEEKTSPTHAKLD